MFLRFWKSDLKECSGPLRQLSIAQTSIIGLNSIDTIGLQPSTAKIGAKGQYFTPI
jgi:hypothetical protein